MKLRPEQLASHLKHQLAKVYLLHGDEPLLINECVAQIIASAKQQDFFNVERIQITAKFHWQEFLNQAATIDLFSPKKLFKLDMPNGKPGTSGTKAIVEYIENATPESLLIITCEKLESGTFKTAWYKAIEKQGAIIQTYSLQGQELYNWLKQRFLLYQMQITPPALELFANKIIGNLLAADQEIQKLLLIYGATEITEQHITSAIGDHAHFDIFNLVDAWLNNNTLNYLRILNNLKAQDIAPVLIIWALSREARQLAQAAFKIEQGVKLSHALPFAPHFRRPLIEQHLKQHNASYYYKFLQQCAEIDRVTKGADEGNVWLLLEKLSQTPCKI